jgi:GH15 family glucan-1,4-alpha-glucosidase
MVLETIWQTHSGWVVVTDFLAMEERQRDARRSDRRRRAPGDMRARHLLVRTAKCWHGQVEMEVRVEPSYEYGSKEAKWEYIGDGYGDLTSSEGGVELCLSSSSGLGVDGPVARGRKKLREGETMVVMLAWSGAKSLAGPEEAEGSKRATERFWRSWSDSGRLPDHPWRETIGRSALTLKGLTYSPTGALLAASTTSLPEWPGGTRNWDYRYTWLRDSAFALEALSTLGFDSDADDFLAFLGDVLGSSKLVAGEEEAVVDIQPFKVLYAVDGSEAEEEKVLEHLGGYGGAKPVRIGNAAAGQVQLDVLGSVVECIYSQVKSRDSLSERSWALVLSAAGAVMRGWREPDHGIWEVRGERRHFTFSKIMCWVALTRGTALARLRGEDELADIWEHEAWLVGTEVLEKGVSNGHLSMYYGSDEVDASLLLASRLRFLGGDDELMRGTVAAVLDQLSEGAFISRYRTGEIDDGLFGEHEGSFTICSFWLVYALVDIGEVAAARANFERLVAAGSSLGLFAEQINVADGSHLGNFPQAFSHLALINAGKRVIEAEESLAAKGDPRSLAWQVTIL